MCFCFFFFLNGGKEAKGFHLVSFRTVKFHHFFVITLHTTMKKDVETFRILLRRRMSVNFCSLMGREVERNAMNTYHDRFGRRKFSECKRMYRGGVSAVTDSPGLPAEDFP